MFKNIDKTKPMTDEQYEKVKKLSDKQKRDVMSGFKSTDWSQEDIERHYRADNFPVVKYHSSGGGGVGSLTPPKTK